MVSGRQGAACHGGGWVAIRKAGPHNGGGEVGTLKWWRQSGFALKKLSS